MLYECRNINKKRQRRDLSRTNTRKHDSTRRRSRSCHLSAALITTSHRARTELVTNAGASFTNLHCIVAELLISCPRDDVDRLLKHLRITSTLGWWQRTLCNSTHTTSSTIFFYTKDSTRIKSFARELINQGLTVTQATFGFNKYCNTKNILD